LCYAPILPHEPHDAPQQYLDLYRDDAALPAHLRAYYANIAWFDDTVGKLLAYLQRKGLAQNTLFVYICDNGATPQVTSPYKVDPRSKRSPFENGLRTPVLLRWDGHIQPATHEGLVSSVDLLPTVLSALGIDTDTRRLPGIDLMPSATGQSTLDADRPVFGEIYPGDAATLGQPERHVAYRWVRRGPLKLIVPHAHEGSKPWGNFLSRPALFHLVNDPEETNDLSSDQAYANDITRLTGLLDDWWNPD
jgi:uncharacterized sulfatase